MALEDYRADMKRCSRCSYCKWIPFAHIKSWRFSQGCPSIAYNKFQCYSAGGRLSVALSLLEGRCGYTKELLDVVYKCHLCGLCDVSDKVCRYNMEPLQALRELRFKLNQDHQVLPQHTSIMDSLRREDNVMMKPRTGRGEWAEGLDVKDLSRKKSEVLFFAGCRPSFDDGLRKVARTAVSVLRQAGVDLGIMGKDETCCGGRVYDMGYKGDFIRCAERNIKAWRSAGVKTVVTGCSECYYAFKRLYPELGSEFKVLHTVELLDRLIKEGKIRFTRPVPLTVTYHDPCHLGRQGESYVPWQGVEKKIRGQIVVYEPKKPRYNGAWGVYDPPRDVLKSIPGLHLIEMERNREYAWCCGAGGGVTEAYPDFSSWTARERIEEAAATGAEAIVSACPWCERNFLNATGENGQHTKVFDIVELVQQAI